MGKKKLPLEITWPLYGGGQARPFSSDPDIALSAFAPSADQLSELTERTDLPDSNEEAEREARRLHESRPPGAPEWLQAAQALSGTLGEIVARGDAGAVEQAAIARAWAAWCLGGASEAHVLKVAHVVGRAHAAIRDSRRSDISSAITACASVLHSNLPGVIRDRMPFARVVLLVRALRDQADAWTAVVEGTAELLGWKDYALGHAASVIRAVIERDRSAGP